MAAAASAAKDVVALLLQHVQDWAVQLDAHDAAGNTAVAHAARGGDADVLKMLTAAGLPLQACWPQDLATFGTVSTAGQIVRPCDDTDAGRASCSRTTCLPAGGMSPLAVQEHAGTALSSAAAGLQPGSCSTSATAAAVDRLQLCSNHSVAAVEGSHAGLTTEHAGMASQHVHLQEILSELCLDAGDALMYTAAASGSVGIVAWLLIQGVGEQPLRAALPQ